MEKVDSLPHGVWEGSQHIRAERRVGNAGLHREITRKYTATGDYLSSHRRRSLEAGLAFICRCYLIPPYMQGAQEHRKSP